MGGAPEAGGTSSGVTCMKRSWCGGDLVHYVSQFGNSALVSAPDIGHLEVVKALLAVEADNEAKENVSD